MENYDRVILKISDLEVIELKKKVLDWNKALLIRQCCMLHVLCALKPIKYFRLKSPLVTNGVSAAISLFFLPSSSFLLCSWCKCSISLSLPLHRYVIKPLYLEMLSQLKYSDKHTRTRPYIYISRGPRFLVSSSQNKGSWGNKMHTVIWTASKCSHLEKPESQ